MEEKYLIKICQDGIGVLRMDRTINGTWSILGFTLKNKLTSDSKILITGYWRVVRSFQMKKDAVKYLKCFDNSPLAITDTLSKNDRDKLFKKGFTFYRLRADHSIWYQDNYNREWKQINKFTAEDQAKKELAVLLENNLAIEV